MAVFVYGTLMPGQPRWGVLAPFSASSAPAVASGVLYDTGLGYPAAVFGDGAGEIPGVLVRLRPDAAAEAIEVLDRIEAEGDLYRRVEVLTSLAPAIGYEWLRGTAGLRVLAGGWLP